MNRWSLLKIGTIIVGWRLVLTMLVLLGVWLLPFQPHFPNSPQAELQFLGPRALTTWAHFDGVYYLSIIRNGYKGIGLIQAFFPAYPLLIRYASFGLNPILPGILVSTICFGLGLWLLRKLMLLDGDVAVFPRVFWLLLLFPTAFFFTAVYTEGLFFLLIVTTFLLARKGWFWAAGITGALAAATRLVGIFVVPALLYEYYLQHKERGRTWQLSALWALMPAVGLVAYMFYLHTEFHDPLMFFHVQQDFGTGRETEKLVMLYQVFFRYIKMLLTVDPKTWLFYTVVSEFLLGLSGVVLSVMSFVQTRRSYAIFALLAFVTPTVTGTLTSMPRYLLVLFPFFMVAARLLPEKAYRAVLVVFVIMQIINVLLFTSGWWVA